MRRPCRPPLALESAADARLSFKRSPSCSTSKLRVHNLGMSTHLYRSGCARRRGRQSAPGARANAASRACSTVRVVAASRARSLNRAFATVCDAFACWLLLLLPSGKHRLQHQIGDSKCHGRGLHNFRFASVSVCTIVNRTTPHLCRTSTVLRLCDPRKTGRVPIGVRASGRWYSFEVPIEATSRRVPTPVGRTPDRDTTRSG